MEKTEVYGPDGTELYDPAESILFDPQADLFTADPFGLPFEPMDEFSDAPLEFEELAETLWKILNDTYILSVRYNRHSPFYLKLCCQLEKHIRQFGSLCITKAVLEQKDLSFPKLQDMTIRELYSMVSLHFRKCRQAFQEGCDSGQGHDMEMVDRVCRWGYLAERLKATEERIQKIRSGEINADQYFDRAQVFRSEPRGKRPQRDPREIRKAASLPVISSFASEMVRRQRQEERQKIRAERAREKNKMKSGFGAVKPFPAVPINQDTARKLLLEDAKKRGDPDEIRKIQNEDFDELRIRMHNIVRADRMEETGGVSKKRAAPPSRGGPSDEVRKKLREQRKKKKR